MRVKLKSRKSRKSRKRPVCVRLTHKEANLLYDILLRRVNWNAEGPHGKFASDLSDLLDDCGDYYYDKCSWQRLPDYMEPHE